MARIFLCYRREDSAAHAGRLYDRLGARYGKANVFMDIDGIELGEDFVRRIARTVRACDVFIALIGRNWLTATDATGYRRLDLPNDIVRMEISAALERDIRVIPLLVGGANMPTVAELPELLAPLAGRNGLQVSDARFHEDVDQLVGSIDRIAPPPASKSKKTPPLLKPPRKIFRKLAAVVTVAVLAVVTAWQGGMHLQNPNLRGRPSVSDKDLLDRSSRFDSGRSSRRLTDYSRSSPSYDVETMEAKRRIDSEEMAYERAYERERQMRQLRETQSQQLRQIIDKYNRSAKSIIDSMGR